MAARAAAGRGARTARGARRRSLRAQLEDLFNREQLPVAELVARGRVQRDAVRNAEARRDEALAARDVLAAEVAEAEARASGSAELLARARAARRRR